MAGENCTDDIQKPRHTTFRYWSLLTVLIIVILAAVLRIRLLHVPLERDEGGYAYTAQLILQGIPPFEQAYDIKMPGLYYVYALILAIFGQTTVGIHLGLLVINAATIVLIFFLARRFFDTVGGLVACAAFAVMSLSRYVQGFTANAEQLLLLPALAGILLLLKAADSRRLKTFFAAGLFIGLALVIKHHGIFFVAFAAVYLFVSYLKKNRVYWKRYLLEYAAFLPAVLIPFVLLCVLFFAYGLFHKFRFWLFVYPFEYASQVPFLRGLTFLKFELLNIGQSALPIWILASIGLVALIYRTRKDKRNLSILFFCLVSFLSVTPGRRFFPHYFVLALPAVALLTAAGVGSIAALLANKKSLVIRSAVTISLTMGAILYLVYAERAYLFELSPDEISRTTYGPYFPFAESVKIADYVKHHSSPEDTIAVLGSEPQICFYARRRSASAHIYVYPLMGNHNYAKAMQQEMVREIESACPKFLVFVNSQTSWWFQPYSEPLILKWFRQYSQKYYDLVGVVDVVSAEKSVYRWDEQVVGYTPDSGSFIYVLKRKNGLRLLPPAPH